MASLLRFILDCLCGQQRPQQHAEPAPLQPIHAEQPQPHHHQRPPFSDNQVNQKNPHYAGLRARANQEGDQMGQCFQQSHDAYARGDGALAKELSNKGKGHQKEMERLNTEASDWIFRENNLDSGPGEIDLHGLYVKEAILRTDTAIEQAKRRGDKQIKLIVGKGMHSAGGVAKLKPAIEELMVKHQLVATIDPDNAGVLVVDIDAGRGGMPADEIADRIEKKEEGCYIM